MTSVIFPQGHSLKFINLYPSDPPPAPYFIYIFCSQLYYLYFLFIIMMVTTHSTDVCLMHADISS